MENRLQDWLDMIGSPKNYQYEPSFKKYQTYDLEFGTAEMYRQANGPGTSQRVMMLFPQNMTGPVPAVVVPFYFPEAMLGFRPKSGEVLPSYAGITMMTDLTKRGYATISADAYHLTYLPKLQCDNENFSRWRAVGEALTHDHPEWTGVGKLVEDTKLLIDAISRDPRVDATRIGITGHSLGGKMAFYTGLLDNRIKAIMASDFGIGFEQTNWNDIWYWGDKLEILRQKKLDHSQLLSASHGRPFCLLAGMYDNADSWKCMQQAEGYEQCPESLVIVNHATGHRPPADALQKGYQFLDKWLGMAK